jgi:hypothetical protein
MSSASVPATTTQWSFDTNASVKAVSMSILVEYKLVFVTLAVFTLIIVISYIALSQTYGGNTTAFRKDVRLFPHADTIDGSAMVTIDASELPGSINAGTGMEMSVSMWIRVDDVPKQAGEMAYICYRGNGNAWPSTGLFTPTIMIDHEGYIVVAVNTFENINETVLVTKQHLPIQLFTLLTVSITQQYVDVYFNETLVGHLDTEGLIRFNQGPLYIAPQGGFNGVLHLPYYFNYYYNPNINRGMMSSSAKPKYDGG